MYKRKVCIAIVAGGDIHTGFLPDIQAADTVIGVDRGALWLIRRGIAPEIAIGDFDSVTKREKKQIHDRVDTYIEYSPEKDATDLELAIDEAIKAHPTSVRIYGALGKRFDHALAAAYLLQKLVSHNINGEIVDNFSKIHIVRRRQKFSRNASYRYASVIPLGANATVTLTGFAYSITKRKLTIASTLGISNKIAADTATIKVHQGAVFVIQSTDRRVR